jgi:hypothetical protein
MEAAMAQENARVSRARTPKAKDAAASTVTSVPAKKAATPRTRKKAAVADPTPEAIAFHAYLLWERGEPGDPDAHWLRAERELTTA